MIDKNINNRYESPRLGIEPGSSARQAEILSRCTTKTLLVLVITFIQVVAPKGAVVVSLTRESIRS